MYAIETYGCFCLAVYYKNIYSPQLNLSEFVFLTNTCFLLLVSLFYYGQNICTPLKRKDVFVSLFIILG